MVKLKLVAQNVNDGPYSNKGVFDLNNPQDKSECIEKIIDLLKQYYYDIGNDCQSFEQVADIYNSLDPDPTSRISVHMNLYQNNSTIYFFKQLWNSNNNNNNSNRNNPNRNSNNNNNPTIYIGGKMNKEYISLQSGGRRLVRYGKRGGRYYMKGGKKNYLK